MPQIFPLPSFFFFFIVLFSLLFFMINLSLSFPPCYPSAHKSMKSEFKIINNFIKW